MITEIERPSTLSEGRTAEQRYKGDSMPSEIERYSNT